MLFKMSFIKSFALTIVCEVACEQYKEGKFLNVSITSLCIQLTK